MRPRGYPDYAADGVLVLGGAAAILLQLADPVVARGVARHSDFAHDPLRRLRATLSYVYAVGIGTPEQRDVAAAQVGRRHAPVAGASDPERQLWVAATLYQVGTAVRERLFGLLDPELHDEVYRRSAELGTALGMPAALWPASRSAFAAYWADAVAGLELTVDARDTARQLFAAEHAPRAVRAAMPLVRLITPAFLPETLHDGYGLALKPRRVAAALAVIAGIARLTPWRLRSMPARRLLAAL